jgi:hypothetical protein
LFEPLGELSERSEKKKVRALARWEDEVRVGARSSGLILKCCKATVRSSGAQKDGFGGPVGRENRRIDEIYTPAFSRARGVY